MVNKQPEALRLAALYEGAGQNLGAAAELRRLHAVEQQRDELQAENKLLKATQYGSGRLQELRDVRDKLHAENEDFRATCDHLTRENAEQNDGDALRLAVRLHLDINQFPATDGYVGMIEIWRNGDGDPAHVEYVKVGDDRLIATRRAIVRAAAEIGRNMK